ncbi:MAG: sce7726 family protein [Eubacteriales bacterium]|nr:sce7726 family protein [Eubacteriales bacterium]
MLYDKDIREPLFDYLEERFGKVRIIEEKRTGRSRADVVMVLPNLVVGIEIKSDADTYARLKRQVKDYDLFYDRNYVVVGSTHAMHVSEHIPEYWGIISVEEMDEKIDFYMLREAKDNPKREIFNKLSLLWRPELSHIQELNEMAKYKEKSKLFVMEKIIEKVPEIKLHEQISEELFERDYNTIADTIAQFRQENGRGVRKKKTRRRRRRK